MGHPLDYAALPSPHHRRLLTAVHVGAAAWPFLILAVIYGAWLVAWAILGHRPVYAPGGPDDPTRALGYAHHAALLLTISFPLGMLLGLVSVLIVGITRRAPGRAILWAVALVVLWIAFFNLVWWDPHGAVEWLGD